MRKKSRVQREDSPKPRPRTLEVRQKYNKNLQLTFSGGEKLILLDVNSTLTGSSADNISVQRTINFSCTLQPTIIFSCSKLVKRKGSILKYSLKLKKN